MNKENVTHMQSMEYYSALKGGNIVTCNNKHEPKEHFAK
jgi:hypothetical protein